MKEKNVPAVEPPLMTRNPPYKMIKAIPSPPKNSMIGEESERATTVHFQFEQTRVLSKKRCFS